EAGPAPSAGWPRPGQGPGPKATGRYWKLRPWPAAGGEPETWKPRRQGEGTGCEYFPVAGLSTAAHCQSRQRFTLEYAKLPSGRHLPCAPGNTAKRLALPGKGAILGSRAGRPAPGQVIGLTDTPHRQLTHTGDDPMRSVVYELVDCSVCRAVRSGLGGGAQVQRRVYPALAEPGYPAGTVGQPVAAQPGLAPPATGHGLCGVG